MYFGAGDQVALDRTLGGSLAQVLTHLFVAGAGVSFYLRKNYYSMSLAISTFFFSDIYHICKAGWYCFGLDSSNHALLLPLPALTLARLLDHINSTHNTAAVVLVIAFGDGGGGPHVMAYRLLLFSFTVFTVIAFPFSTNAGVLAFLFAILLVTLDFFVVRRGRLPPVERFPLKYIVPAIVSIGVGFVFFFELLPFLGGEVSHSFWHVFIFLGLWLIVEGVGKVAPENTSPSGRV